MLLHQKSKHVDAGDLRIGIVLTIVCLDQRGESFDETVSAVLRIVADLVHQFAQLFHRGIVFALVAGTTNKPNSSGLVILRATPFISSTCRCRIPDEKEYHEYRVSEC